MFDLFNRRRSRNDSLPAQVVMEGAIEIDAAPADVFERLHPASARHSLIEQGFTLARRADGNVDATHPEMPETVLRLERITATPPERLAFRSRFDSPAPVGGVVRTDSVYVIEPAGERTCCVRLTETVTLRPGVRGSARKREAQLLAEAQKMHLMRLKQQVEAGPR